VYSKVATPLPSAGGDCVKLATKEKEMITLLNSLSRNQERMNSLSRNQERSIIVLFALRMG
jgi:hypothetical protein